MNIAIVSPYATVAPHFETELEIAEQHTLAGDRVDYLYCSGNLANCDFNRDLDPDRCLECAGRRHAGLSLLEQKPKLYELTPTAAELPSLKTEFKSLDELTEYKIDGFDIGYAALSSLVSLVRDPDPDLKQHGPLLERFLNAAFQAYQLTLDYLENNDCDRMYVFNGRFAAMRAVFRACQKMNVDCILHERGCDQDHYELFNNHMPHEIEAIDKTIRRLWDEATNEDLRDQQARAWFQERVERVEKNWHSFTKAQELGRLPENWDADRRNLSIFTSSDDEFVAIGDHWKNRLYENQLVAIHQIATDLLERSPETHIYLRVHPNLTNVQNQRKRDMLSIQYSNLTIIAPGETIDTYALMRSSETVATFGSSVGIEAVFWGIPSVLLGPCLHQHLGGTYQPINHEEALMLMTGDLEPQDKTGALMYGYWLQTRGKRYQHFEADGLFSGHFKGQLIYPGANQSNEPRKSIVEKIGREAKRLLKQLS